MKNQEQKSKQYIPIWIFTAMAFGVLFGTGIKRIGKTTKASELDEILHYVKERYVDSADIEKIEDNAIISALKELDPHSTYLPKEILNHENEQMDGQYEGVGIEFFIQEDTIQVASAMIGGPSKEVGIQAGDKIVTVNDSLVAGVGIQNTDVLKLLKGKKGTTVHVGIQRGKRDKLLDFEITRAPITINSIEVAYMLTEDTGYIKINRFSLKTSKEFRVQLNKLVQEGMGSLIIDLRGNGGGIMKDALEVVDQLISGNRLLLSAEGRKYKREDYEGYIAGLFEEGRVAVLIDESSASASEIVAGALQDWDRAVIIGRRTFGKGLVQQPFPLSDGSGLRLTVARYYTPSGRSIQRSYEEGVDDYYEDFYKRRGSGEMLSKDSIKVDSSLIKHTLINKREVFGGGGISPDVFVPVDTTSVNDFMTTAFSKRLPFKFAAKYYEHHKSVLESYENVEDFHDNFFLGRKAYQEFVDYVNAESKEKSYTTLDTQNSRKEMISYIKALIARQLFDDKGYFIVLNDDDKMIIKALNVLGSDEYNTVLGQKEENL